MGNTRLNEAYRCEPFYIYISTPPSFEKTGVLACVQRAIKHLAIHKKSEIAVVPDKENF